MGLFSKTFPGAKKKTGVFGISCFYGDQLILSFIEKKRDVFQPVGTEAITLEEPMTQQAIISFQERISRYRDLRPVWIHLFLRQAAFIRILSLPESKEESAIELVERRVKEEIPHVAEELIYHASWDEELSGQARQAMIFGISKTVLRESLNRLDRLGMVPDRILLSTEVLISIFRRYLKNQIEPHEPTLLIHLFGRHAELLFMNEGQLTQSRWVSSELPGETALAESIQSALDVFQREMRVKPKSAYLLGLQDPLHNSLINRLGIPTKIMTPWPQYSITPILLGAIEGVLSGSIPEFALPEIVEKRKEEKRVKEGAKFSSAVLLLAFSIFCLSALPLTAQLIQLGWLQFKSSRVQSEVTEVKKMRREAMRTQDFREKKLLPLLIVGTVRDAVQAGILLKEIDYAEDKSVVYIRGVALQQNLVDQMRTAIAADRIFKSVTVERVQSQQDEQGGIGFYFEMKGVLLSEEDL